MKHVFFKSHRLTSHIALWTSLIHFASLEAHSLSLCAALPPSVQTEFEQKHTINFNTVAATEVLRFVSKITGANFIFAEEDLRFTVSIISEEPISAQNILSTLVQVLRIHGLKLLEQDGNFLITKAGESVNQLPAIVTDDEDSSSPLVTRIFTLKNMHPSTLAGIIRPMTSLTSLIEVLPQTNQLVVTDITTNVNKIAALLQTLDSPNSNLEIESFSAKHVALEEIIELTKAIITPFTQGNTLLLIPQTATNTIFIVSTPHLIEQALSVMEDLDVISKLPVLGAPSINNIDIHIYKIIHQSPTDLIKTLQSLTTTPDASNLSPSLVQAIQGVRYISQTGSLIFFCNTDDWKKLETILGDIDTSSYFGTSGKTTFWIYKLQNGTSAQMQAALKQFSSDVDDINLQEVIAHADWIPNVQSFVFNGPESTIQNLKTIVPALDVPSQEMEFYVYHIQNITPQQLKPLLEELADTTPDKDLARAIRDMKWVPDNNSIIFHGTPTTLTKIQNILPSLDSLKQTSSGAKSQFFMYKIKIAPEAQIAAALKQMSTTVQDPALVEAIQSMSWIQNSNTLLFTGTQDAINKLETILPGLDSLTPQAAQANSQFLIYSPKSQTLDSLEKAINELATKLKSSGLQNSPLLNALDSLSKTSTSNSLVFTGDPSSLAQIQTILQNLDVPGPAPLQTFVYKPIYASQQQLQSALTQFAQNLDPSNKNDEALAQTIYNAQWSSDALSFIFKGDAATLARLKTALINLDSPQGVSTITAGGFYLYPLRYVQGDIVLKNITNLATNLPTDNPSSQSVVKAIKDIKWIKDNNSLLITGTPYAIDQIKSIIAEFDTQNAQVIIPVKSDFFIYKPIHLSAQQVQAALIELVDNLEESGLSDPSLLQTLKSAHVVSGGESILFTGTPDSLSKIKTLIPTIDRPETNATNGVQTLGETTFLIYKIKQAPSDQLLQALQNFATQLNGSNIADQELAKSLHSVKWIKDTNSLLFTGPTTTLKQVEELANKFDLGTIVTPPPPRETPATFTVYNPKSQTGTELIATLQEFMQNLVRSGVSEPKLFDTINHLRFIEKTNSLIISGDAESIARVEGLLKQFDIPSTNGEETPKTTSDSANFLIHKLQYHPGADIQVALKKVASSITQSAEDANTALVEAINSLQWVEITNSLLGTGDADTLLKVKGLIESLDIPLRQVFIEVLVVETSLFNTQNFGLQWGSQFQYLNKTIGALGNFPPLVTTTNSNTNTPPGTLNLSDPLSFATNLNTPVQGSPTLSPTAVPFSTGFDLGVIGDMLFHKGQSFISLGSLLNALQIDNDTTVVMNPKIITQDGHTSNIFVGQNIPFVGSFVSNSSSSTVQSSNIEYRDVGFSLTITPTLGTNNVITLDIHQDISEQSNTTTQVQGSQVTGIQTTHTVMNTRVHVPDKHFLVLSGMIQDTKNHFRSSIPCLGGLPVIGALFAENDRANTKSNVIIFLRPFIIDSYADYDRLTTDEEDLFKQQAGLHDLKEEFDAGTEMIKNLHNE